jgi:hypothetical protein
MQVIAFAPALKAVLEESGGVTTAGFPMTSAHVTSLPAQITVPLVLAVYTKGGTDYDPRLYVVAKSAKGERLAAFECAWHWPDNPGAPVKFRVFVHQLSMTVQSAGVCTVGLYDSIDATETDHSFPLPVLKASPFAQPPSQPSARL